MTEFVDEDRQAVVYGSYFDGDREMVCRIDFRVWDGRMDIYLRRDGQPDFQIAIGKLPVSVIHTLCGLALKP